LTDRRLSALIRGAAGTRAGPDGDGLVRAAASRVRVPEAPRSGPPWAVRLYRERPARALAYTGGQQRSHGAPPRM